MADLDTLFERIKALPPHEVDRVEDFVRCIEGARPQILHPGFAATCGTIRGEEAEDWRKAMEDCERIDDDPAPRFD